MTTTTYCVAVTYPDGGTEVDPYDTLEEAEEAANKECDEHGEEAVSMYAELFGHTVAWISARRNGRWLVARRLTVLE